MYLGLSRDSAAPDPARAAGPPTPGASYAGRPPGGADVAELFVDLSPKTLVDKSRKPTAGAGGPPARSASSAVAGSVVPRGSEEPTGSRPGSTLTASRTGDPSI